LSFVISKKVYLTVTNTVDSITLTVKCNK